MSTTKKTRARKAPKPAAAAAIAERPVDVAGEELVEHLGMTFPRNLRVDEAMQTGNMALVVAVRSYRQLGAA